MSEHNEPWTWQEPLEGNNKSIPVVVDCEGNMDVIRTRWKHAIRCVNACAGLNPDAIPALIKACKEAVEIITNRPKESPLSTPGQRAIIECFHAVRAKWKLTEAIKKTESTPLPPSPGEEKPIINSTHFQEIFGNTSGELLKLNDYLAEILENEINSHDTLIDKHKELLEACKEARDILENNNNANNQNAAEIWRILVKAIQKAETTSPPQAPADPATIAPDR